MNRKQRRAAEAAAEVAASTTTLPPAFIAAFNEALRLQEGGNLDAAEKYYLEAKRLYPFHALLYSNLGVLNYTRGDLEQAIELHKKAITLDPKMGIAYNNLGVSYNKLERHDEAIEAFEKAIEIEPTNSRALNNLGDSLTKSGRFERSIPNIEKALALDTNYAEAKSNMGMALWGLGDLEGAIKWLRDSLKLNPNLAPVHKNLGLVLLLKGDLNESWVEYNYRLTADNVPLRGGTLPIWRGQNLGEGGLFVFSEQGVGDEILYASLLPDLVERGVSVVWDTDKRLNPIIKRSFPEIRVIPRPHIAEIGSPAPDVVAQLPAGSLGQIFRRSLDQFPRHKRGYLVPDKARMAAYRVGLGLQPGEKLIGMSWVSKNIAFGRYKSTTLADWAEIMKTPGVRFVNLQYGDTAQERADFEREFGIKLLNVDGLDLRDDLDGMAALTAACDHVITVSNTTAHVAAALGIPTTVLVPLGGGKLWYWGLDRDWSPWYPCVSIIRQINRHEWTSTMRVAADRLRALAAS